MDDRIYDRQMYGAEDNEELDRILEYIERATEEQGGPDASLNQSPIEPRGARDGQTAIHQRHTEDVRIRRAARLYGNAAT